MATRQRPRSMSSLERGDVLAVLDQANPERGRPTE